MSQETCEWIIKISGVCHVTFQMLFFWSIWNIFYPVKEKGKMAAMGILAGVNFFVLLLAGINSWVRYPISAVLVLAVAFIRNREHVGKALFVLPLFYNFHALSFLIANGIHQWEVDWAFQRLEPFSEDYLSQIYQNTAWGQGLMLASYGLLFLGMILILKKIVKKPWDMNWQDVIFLSFPNVAGGMLARMVLELSMVEMEQGIFLLFDEKKDMVWKIPLVAALIFMGEMSAIYIFQQYGILQQEWQKHFVEAQQMKAIQRRLEEAEDFYGSIRKARHEMKNHMANLKGLVAGEHYQAAEQYMEKLEETMETLDYQFATGNPVTDVVINDKYRKANALGIDFRVNFMYEKDDIPVFDMGILLNNLLDNAIEACEKLEENQRYIRLYLKRRDHFLLLEVENSFDGVIKWEKGSSVPATRKKEDSYTSTARRRGKEGSVGAARKWEEGSVRAARGWEEPLKCMEHGIGLKNVEEIAKRYLGVMDIKINGNVFRITVMLQQENNC